MNVKCLIICASLLIVPPAVKAQPAQPLPAAPFPALATNPPAGNVPTTLPDSTAADIAVLAGQFAKVLNDFGVDVSARGLGGFLFFLFAGARIARKGLPDRSQTGLLGKVLAHVALEINPTPGRAVAQASNTNPPPKV